MRRKCVVHLDNRCTSVLWFSQCDSYICVIELDFRSMVQAKFILNVQVFSVFVLEILHQNIMTMHTLWCMPGQCLGSFTVCCIPVP